jgi:hypothetical protein
MTEVAGAEVPIEPAPPIPIENAPTPVSDEPIVSSAGAPAGATGEVETEVVESFDPRISIPESLGRLRRAILEGLIDADAPMSVSQLHACMPVGTPRGTTEAGILREYRSGRIERVGPGIYRLAPPKPAEPPKPSPDPPQAHGDGLTEEAVFEALERWATDSASWNVERFGPPPDDENTQISLDVRTRFFDRIRKKEARRREASAADAKRVAADRELRDKLIAATHGGFTAGPALDDVSPIRAAMELVSLERILQAVRHKTDPKCDPKNTPATSWRDPRLLEEIAEQYCQYDVVPRLVEAWRVQGRRLRSPPARRRH